MEIRVSDFEVPKLNNNQTDGSNNSASQTTVDVKLSKADDKPLKDLAERLGISLEQLKQIVDKSPQFLFKTFEEQQKELLDGTAAKPAEVKSSAQASTKQFSKADFANLQPEQQKDLIKLEFAKNIYTYGSKGKNGTVNMQAHTDKPWEKLSEAEQKAYLEQFNAFIENDENFQQMKKDLEAADSKNSNKDKDFTKIRENYIVNAILAANNEGMSVTDFMKLGRGKRQDAIIKYLENNSVELPDLDQKFLNRIKNYKSNAVAYLKKYGISKEGDLSCEQIEKYLTYSNTTQQDLELFKLEERQKRGETLTSEEQARFNILKTDASKSLNVEQKARNYGKLKNEFEALKLKNKKQKGKLTEQERETYNLLRNTLNTKESKELEKVEPYEPKTTAERFAANQMEEINKRFTDFAHDDNTAMHLKYNAVLEEANKLPENERQEFLRNVMKYDPAFGAKWLGKLTTQEGYPDLVSDPDLIRQASLNVANMPPEVLKNYRDTVSRAWKSPRYKGHAECGMRTEGQIWRNPSYDKKSEYDARKASYTDFVSQFSDLESNKLGIEVANTMASAELQGKAYAAIQNGEATKDAKANDEIQCYAAKSAVGAYAENQVNIITIATDKSAAATKMVAEEDIISKLDKTAQTGALKATHKSINKHFEGEDAIKYSNSLADQIQNCDKDNQLAMHEEMMTSKYSQVQEHVAGNVKNYDPSVQLDALRSVYRSGNQKAIEAAVSSISEFKSPDVQEVALKEAFVELYGAEKILTLEQIRKLSPAERDEYFKNIFENATPAEKIKFLKFIIKSSVDKKAAYNLIGTYHKNLFIQMIKGDPRLAKEVLMVGVKPELANVVIRCVENEANTNASFKEVWKDICANDKSVAQAAEENLDKYSTSPFERDNVFNDKKYEMFRKGQFGYLLG